MEIMVRHRGNRPEPRGERPWFFVEQRVNVGGIPRGQAGEFVLPIKWAGGKPNTGDRLVAAHAESEAFSASLVNAAPQGRETLATIRIRPSDGYEGPFAGPVVIEGEHFVASVPVVGHAARSVEP
jgi:hypothetical protein